MIDRVVRIIRTADDDDDSKRKLMAELRYVPHGQTAPVPIDDIQAQHIIDMALKKINTLNQFKINEELRTKAARVDEITGILVAEGGVNEIVRAELKQTRKQFGQPRRTVIPDSEAVDAMAANATAAVERQTDRHRGRPGRGRVGVHRLQRCDAASRSNRETGRQLAAAGGGHRPLSSRWSPLAPTRPCCCSPSRAGPIGPPCRIIRCQGRGQAGRSSSPARTGSSQPSPDPTPPTTCS